MITHPFSRPSTLSSECTIRSRESFPKDLLGNPERVGEARGTIPNELEELDYVSLHTILEDIATRRTFLDGKRKVVIVKGFNLVLYNVALDTKSVTPPFLHIAAEANLGYYFKGEAVNTACYVQNRVLVIKPHNKTPYELFLGRKPALSFMRPFGCPVTILNTIDHLGQFDGKADEGFFVGYSTNSKAFRVFNRRTRIVEENLHVKFSEDAPNIAGSGPNYLFNIDALINSINYKPVIAGNQSTGNTGTKVCNNADKARMETILGKDYILLPLSIQDPPFSSSLKDSPNAGFKPSGEEEKKDVEDPGNKDSKFPSTEEPRVNQEKDASVNNTNTINTVSLTVNTAGVEDNVYVGAEADINNLDTRIPVSPIPTTKIHKDHLVEQIIGDIYSAPQTKRMTKSVTEHAMFSSVQQRTNHKDFQNCLFACFLSQEEPKKVIQALKDPSWIEAMQEELLQFKLQQIQALVDKKKVIITETSVRSDLQLEDAQGTECLPNTTIFEQLTLMGAKTTAWNEFSSTMAFLSLYCPINQIFNFSKYIFDNMVKNLEGGVKFLMYPRQGKDFSGRDTPLFPTMIVQAQEQVGEGSEIPTDSHYTPTTTQPSTSKPQKKQSRRKQRKDTEDPQLSGPTEPVTDDTENMESVPTHSNDPLLSGEDRLKLTELMELCTKLSERVLDLEKTKTSQAVEITELKKRVKKLEGKRKSKPPGMKRLFKIGRYAQVVSSKDEGLGDQEDASKQGRKIADIDADAEVTLVDETQGRNDEEMFDIGILDGEEVFAEQDVVEKEVSTAEVATDSTTTTTVDELTLAQTLIEIKAAKPKAVTTAATTTTTSVTRPKARGIVVQEPSEFTTTTSLSQPAQLPQVKDKGKAKMVEPEKPLKKKDQIMFDKEDNVQAKIDADYKLAARLQAEEQGELTVEEKSRLFVELMNKMKKHFARLREEEQRRKPSNKAQKRNTMSTYLKNMAGYKHNQLKTKSFEDIQMLFDKENTFVDIDTELVKGSETRTEGSSTRAGEELESKNLKKQKLDENVEAEVDDDQEEAEMKKYMEIVPDDEVAIDAIPLATKPPIIVDWKIIKEGKMGYFQIIRADRSSKRYSSMILMLQNIDREDLETLWKLVKAKHGLTRPEEAYERVLWGDLKVMFEPDVESEVWRNLQGHKVTVWKLFSSSGVQRKSELGSLFHHSGDLMILTSGEGLGFNDEFRAPRRQRWHKKAVKRAGDELEQEKAKKQKIDNDEAEMKKHMEIVPDDEVAIDTIPLATKPPIIID
ncbi:retrovirus-related pol polyprotein from transposon TNT 1-94 [Tanacetum coccineum]